MKRYRVLTLIPLAVCILFIWGNSMQDADRSGERSVKVTELVNDFLQPKNPVLEQVIRKEAHLAEFALEGMCVALVFWAYGRLRRSDIGNGILIGVFTALADESIQAGSPGRFSSVGDVWIDLAGFIAGAGVLTAVICAVRRLRRKAGKNI